MPTPPNIARAWMSRVPVTAERVDTVWRATATAPDSARYGYAIEGGTEAGYRLLAALLRDSVRVWYARRSFRVGQASFPEGA